MSLFRKSQSASKSNLEVGRWGEKQAIKYLKKQKYKIIQKNFRTHTGEIDIIASKQNVLIFVEVKTQRGVGAIEPEQRVGLMKKRQLVKLAKYYIARTKTKFDEVRMDIITVTRTGKNIDIKHIEGAFGDE
jgi:putative endonuclease